MATDKKISELPVASSINTADVSILVHNDIDYQFAFTTLLSFIGSNLALGANITYGTSVPSNGTGNNGDVFIKTNENKFYQKLAGAWTLFLTIAPGVVGNVIKYGTGNPNGTVTGNSGDLFIDTAAAIFYSSGGTTVWTAQFSMATGPAGPPGTAGTNGTNGTNGLTVLNGTSNPSNGLGVNGDFYININTWAIFGPKSAGAWPAGESLIGPDGDPGNTILYGTSDPVIGTGVNGDFYINTSTHFIFGPKASGVWPTGTSIIGPAGATGATGAAGTNGATIIYGAGAPGSGTGNNGDTYINTTNNFIYGPKASGSWPSGISLVGPTGATGATGATGPAGPGVPVGGTTGQVLAKNSNTDFDDHWVTPPAGFVNPMTTKGDIIKGDTAGAAIRMALGSAGYYMAVNAAATDVVYQELKLNPYTVAGLPSAGSSNGILAYVTDANGPILNAPVTGGGTTECIVWSNGTSWVAIGGSVNMSFNANKFNANFFQSII